MSLDEVAKLKAELHALNCHIQAERNDEVRHGLQRCRLEAERAQTLVKLMDAQAALRDTPPPLPHITPQQQSASAAPVSARRKVKPDGIPSTSAMIITALRESGRAARPPEIEAYIRQRWWPELPTGVIGTAAWHMAKDGKLENNGGRYKLNGHGSHY